MSVEHHAVEICSRVADADGQYFLDTS